MFHRPVHRSRRGNRDGDGDGRNNPGPMRFLAPGDGKGADAAHPRGTVGAGSGRRPHGLQQTPGKARTPERHDMRTQPSTTPEPAFPVSAGVFFGLGLGGFFDGIVLHQVLQWHHMASSAGFATDTVEGLRWNILFDGLFHMATYVFVLVGLVILWRRGRRRHLGWSTTGFAGSLLVGFGAFNLVEGTLNHHVLGLHHVNETVPRAQWIYWDVGFLIWGAVLLVVGLILLARRRPKVGTP